MLYVRMLGPVLHEETAALQPVIRAVVACILGADRSHPDVEDCTHEALRRAMEGRDRLRPGEPLRPWVLGIARHVALDALRARRKARLRYVEDADGDEAERSGVVERLADEGEGPDDRLANAERQQRLRAAIESLPEGQRNALTLFHGEGLGYQDISRRLGVPLGTVATWITRGRQSVSDALADMREA